MTWREAAACHPTRNPYDPHIFDADPAPGETWDDLTTRHDTAAALCGTCPVAAACLRDALADPTREGVYAGYLLEVERTQP